MGSIKELLGGHELPEILDNKEISEAFIECMMEFFAM